MRAIAITAAAVVLLTACGSQDSPPAASQPTTSTSSSSPAVDPYDVYLKNAPKGEPKLSREDASTRARLGCERKWPPGTVDAVLQEAYAAYCK